MPHLYTSSTQTLLNIKGFFPIQKDLSQSYNCSALIIAPENKISMIKRRVVYMTVKR